jgi:adenosylcobyric acid synthase
MLGKTIDDPQGIEGQAGKADGLGLLDVETVLTADKRLVATNGRHVVSGEAISGYEIHIGRTEGADCSRPFAMVAGSGGTSHPDGAVSANGRIMGTYMHGLFGSDGFRGALLASFGGQSSLAYEAVIEATLDALAAHLEASMDIDAIMAIAKSRL